MYPWQALQLIQTSGLVAIIRTSSQTTAEQAALSCLESGIQVLEVSLTTPDGLQALRNVRQHPVSQPTLLGAGTVLDPETARAAILAGAQLVVTPSLNPETVRLCRRYQVPTLVGAQTVREVQEALEAGADLVKVFPGELLGPTFVKAVRGPLPQAPMVPTGGVNLANLGEWFKAGSLAVGVGGVFSRAAEAGDLVEVRRMARAFVQAIQAIQARS